MRKTVRILESISEWTGRIVSWLCLALVLVVFAEVFMRFVLDSPTSWTYEVSTAIALTIYVMGLAYTHLHHGHVRIDIFWRLLSPRGKAVADVIGGLLFFLPPIILLTYISAVWTHYSIETGEIMYKTIWYPPAWPVRAVMTLGLFLFIPQGVARLIRDLYMAARNETL